MRRLKIAVCLIFVASCVIFAGYTVKSKMLEDHTPPVITCKDKTVTLSVQTDQKKQKKALLKGVKAEDNRDGDLTSSVRIASMSHFIAPGKRTITYVYSIRRTRQEHWKEPCSTKITPRRRSI